MSTKQPTTPETQSPAAAHVVSNDATRQDPSAAEAVEDDADDWEPLIPAEEFVMTKEDVGGGATGNNDNRAQQQEEVNRGFAEVLQAVDDLLKQEEEEASTDGSSTDDSATGAKHDDDNNGKIDKKESPLKLRRRLRAAREKLKDSVARPVARFSVNTTRRVVTGSHETRIRDFVALPHVVRVLDKYMFTFGILGMLWLEFIVLQYPAYFRYNFVALMLPLLILRVVLFRRTKQHYFLLDYCYWVNLLGLFVSVCPEQWLPKDSDLYDILWQVLFVSANGPLFFAMVAWNNSLVFHSIDKLTSTIIHICPAILSLCERWRSDRAMNLPELPLSRHLGYPLLFYAAWQTVYLLQTEWLHKKKLDADPELSTSLRYLTTAEKMAIHKKTLKLCRSVGIMGPTETFNPPTFKVKFIFVFLQAVMTLVTFLPLALFYRYEKVHYAVVSAILTFSVYNGARYYVQVFSRIYEKRYSAGGDSRGSGTTTTKEDDDYVDTSAPMTQHTKEMKKKE